MASTHGMQTRSRSQPPVEDGGVDLYSTTDNPPRAPVTQRETTAESPVTETHPAADTGNNGGGSSPLRAWTATVPRGEEPSFEERERALQRRIALAKEERRLLALEMEAEEAERELAELKAGKRPALQTTPASSFTAAPVIRLRSDTADAADRLDPKRARGTDADEQKRRTIAEESKLRVVDPDPYHGKSYGEYATFIYRCENVFGIRRVTYAEDEDRVRYAMLHLRDEPEKTWWRHSESMPGGVPSATWEHFKEVLLEAVQPKSLRVSEAWRRYLAARQRADQGVPAFAAYLDELETQLPPQAEDLRIHTLLNGLQSHVRQVILERENLPETRQELIALATKIYESRKGNTGGTQDKGKSGGSRTQKGSGKSAPQQGKDDDGVDRATIAGSSRKRPRRFAGTCNYCGKYGHREAECRSKSGTSSKEKPKDGEQAPKGSAQ